MFLTGSKVRSVMEIVKLQARERLESACYEVPLFVRDNAEYFVERFGKLDISGFSYECEKAPRAGQLVQARLLLVGLGREIQIYGRVVGIVLKNGYAQVDVDFVNISFEEERMIARWIDMISRAHRNLAVG
jgi:hypothetical protein